MNQTLQVDSYLLPRVEELFVSLSDGNYLLNYIYPRPIFKCRWKMSQNNMWPLTLTKCFNITDSHLGFYHPLPFCIQHEKLVKRFVGVSVYLENIWIIGSCTPEHLRNLYSLLEN